jgi:peroxiredoxin Q/BCP
MLKEGDFCPNFEQITDDGTKVNNDFFKGSPLVIFFYPKDLTPGCTIESCDFSENYAEIKDLGANLIGVSKDTQKTHLKFKDKYSLKFPLLVDYECKFCNAFGVLKEKSMFGKKYMGIIRSTFILDSDGKIIKVWPNVKIKGHVKEVIEFLRQSV